MFEIKIIYNPKIIAVTFLNLNTKSSILLNACLPRQNKYLQHHAYLHNFNRNTPLHRIHSLIKNKLLEHYVYLQSTSKTLSKLYKTQENINALKQQTT